MKHPMAFQALLSALLAAAVQGEASSAELLRVAAAAAADSECSDKATVSRATCLGKSSKCMFLELDKRNLCLPCEWGGAPIPCVPQNAAFPQGRVESCEMSCEHQQLVSKVSDCTDVSGDIIKDDCFAKGTSAGISCMWTAYTRKDGSRKSICGPCKVDGFGVVGRSAPGTFGPEPGSLVESSFSQCDEQQLEAAKPCIDPKDCPKAVPDVPPKEGDEPVVMTDLTRLGLNTTVDAPAYYAAPVSPPYGKQEFVDAAKKAAKAAGWKTEVSDVASVDVAFVEPGEGPKIPPGIKSKKVSPLPGLLFPVPGFRQSPGNSAILAEPGDSFTPKVIVPDPQSLLQEQESSGKRRLRKQP
mmetsp:Transcript_16885/g.39781  ORF Transcript_16885/g.39781 Transcript_16885/m.39781 type:complete len:356 (+) Transcript_16885:3-1070(+)